MLCRLAQRLSRPPWQLICLDELLVKQQRCLSLLAWGRNAEGQCGTSDAPVVFEPTAVEQLKGPQLRSVAAGRLNSVAVTAQGEAWAWGEGRAGKLGHGNGADVALASRVEALVGRVSIQSVAMGDNHTLFLDSSGSVWGCGENKEGQLGLGTPIEVIASQHRAAFYGSVSPTAAPAKLRAFGQAAEEQGRGLSGGTPPAMAHPSETFPWLKDANLSGRDKEFNSMKSRLQRRATEADQQAAASFLLGAFGLREDTGGLDSVQPGQLHYPARLGLDRHPLGRMRHPAGHAPLHSADDLLLGLEDERVLGLAASGYFSAAVTAAGEVWTFGACFNGSLGGDSNWTTAAQRVGEPLSSLLAENGGAVAVAAGSTFCTALTASGSVVVWGKVPNPLPRTSASAASGALAPIGTPGGRIVASRSARPSDSAQIPGAVVPGLPPIRHMAAGRHHVLLSDGETVWGFGRWMDDLGEESGGAPPSKPVELLRLPAEGVASVHCGAHSSAVLSKDGRVWMWGRILDQEDAAMLLQRENATAGQLPEALSQLPQPCVDWSWAGFGAAEPTLVEGLSGVRGFALGGYHALAIVD